MVTIRFFCFNTVAYASARERLGSELGRFVQGGGAGLLCVNVLHLDAGVNLLEELKIIAVTASVMDENRQELMEIGTDDFLREPFREAGAVAKVRPGSAVTRPAAS